MLVQASSPPEATIRHYLDFRKSRCLDFRKSGFPEFGIPEFRISGNQDFRNLDFQKSGYPEWNP